MRPYKNRSFASCKHLSCVFRYAKNYCIEDVTQLVQCVKYVIINIDELSYSAFSARKPGPTLCAAEFLRMRECNRSEGRQLYISVREQHMPL